MDLESAVALEQTCCQLRILSRAMEDVNRQLVSARVPWMQPNSDPKSYEATSWIGCARIIASRRQRLLNSAKYQSRKRNSSECRPELGFFHEQRNDKETECLEVHACETDEYPHRTKILAGLAETDAEDAVSDISESDYGFDVESAFGYHLISRALGGATFLPYDNGKEVLFVGAVNRWRSLHKCALVQRSTDGTLDVANAFVFQPRNTFLNCHQTASCTFIDTYGDGGQRETLLLDYTNRREITVLERDVDGGTRDAKDPLFDRIHFFEYSGLFWVWREHSVLPIHIDFGIINEDGKPYVNLSVQESIQCKDKWGYQVYYQGKKRDRRFLTSEESTVGAFVDLGLRKYCMINWDCSLEKKAAK